MLSHMMTKPQSQGLLTQLQGAGQEWQEQHSGTPACQGRKIPFQHWGHHKSVTGKRLRHRRRGP
jgi:hypothetical protein